MYTYIYVSNLTISRKTYVNTKSTTVRNASSWKGHRNRAFFLCQRETPPPLTHHRRKKMHLSGGNCRRMSAPLERVHRALDGGRARVFDVTKVSNRD